MYIKSYQCKRFAGLRDINLEFKEGLNVILGPNESGKSTIVDGIQSTLFKNIRIRRNNNADLDFSFKFMPKPMGDFIDGRVALQCQDGMYEISKEWGTSESIELITPNGNILRNENDINDELKSILSFGESTYSNIVFAKQRDIKEALFNIINNSDIRQEINYLLRMTMMELDGISIDSIQRNIEEEIDNLYKRWDRDRNCPINNRDINNPYITGLGKIIESYYNKEKLRRLMEKAKKSEIEFETISNKIKENKDNKHLIDKEKLQLEEIEDDVNNRGILDVKIQPLNKDLKDLTEANREWPKTEQILGQLKEKLEAFKEKKEELMKERKDLEKVKLKEKLESQLEKIEYTQGKIDDIEEDLSNIGKIKDEDIKKLEGLQREILTCETTMKAGKMIGLFSKTSDKAVYLAKDFNEFELVGENVEFEANGLIKIKYGHEFEIEIKTGEIDFEELNNKYSSLGEEYNKKLEDLGIDSLESGKLNLQKIRDKEAEKTALKRELDLILDGSTIEDIDLELKGLGDIKVFKNLEDIESELTDINEEEIDIKAEERNKEGLVNSWIEKYIDHDSLLDLIIEKKTSLKEKEKELEDLKPLPEDFETVEDFKDRLKYLKEELGRINLELEHLNIDYFEAKSNLLDETYEEYKKQFKDAEKTYNRYLRRGEKLLEIQRVFLETKERLSSDPMKPLVEEFARLLEIITQGRYKTGEIDEDFNIKLENPNGEIPIELLSAGTYDSVTLALRFSLLKHIFNDKNGYVILDDCLVDLDPIRKEEAINLIVDFSKEYQIIFTTCNPETAEALGGNLIKL